MQLDTLMMETAWLRRLARGLLRDDSAVDDVVQDTMIAATRDAPRDRPLRPWLHRVLRNRVLMHVRGRSRREARELATAEPRDSTATPEELVARVELQRRLASLVLELAPPARDIVLLHYAEGLTSREIAARLGIPDGTVRWRLKQSLDELRTKLDDQHDGNRAAWIAALGPLAAEPAPAPPVAGPAIGAKLALLAALVVALVLVGSALWAPIALDRPPSAGSGSSASTVASGAARASAGKPPPKVEHIEGRGRITRASDGAGIPGAVVAVFSQKDLRADLEIGSGDLKPLLITVTDQSGTWHADLDLYGSYGVAATAPGFLPASQYLDVYMERGFDLQLADGGTTVSGTISDVGGGPIAHVRISAASSTSTPFVALTDRDGRYRLTLPEGPHTLHASHADYVETSRELVLDGAPHTVDVALTPSATIRGRVVARGTGTPVAGAAVSGTIGPLRVSATSDADGEFALHRLDAGEVAVSASAPGLVVLQPVVVPVAIAQEVTDVSLSLERGFAISGRVVAAEDERGLANVTVMVGAIDERMLRTHAMTAAGEATTDGDGHFEIIGLRPGAYMLAADTRDRIPDLVAPFELADHDATGVTLKLARGITLEGRVTPAAEAELALELEPAFALAHPDQLMKSRSVHERSDASGAFKLTNVPAIDATLVATTKDGRVGRTRVTGPADQRNLVIELRGRAAVAGRVVDASGEPVAGVQVIAQVGYEQLTATTSASGAFRIVGLPAGSLSLAVLDHDGSLDSAESARPPLELAGTDITGLRLAVERRDGSIRGVVLGADRKPVADARVTARLDDGDGDDGDEWARERGVLTDALGRFEIKGLRRAAYRLVADSSNGTARAVRGGLRSGATPTLVLEPLAPASTTATSPLDAVGSLTGVVIDASGVPLAGAYVWAVRRISVPLDVTRAILKGLPVTDAAGRFELAGRPAGDGFLFVTAPDGYATLARVPYRLAAGQRLDLGAIAPMQP